MKLVCSYCGKVIRRDPGGRILDVSHGMCPACAERLDRLWSGVPLAEHLDGLPLPALVMTGDGRIVAANARAGALAGRDPGEMRGLLGGEALACVHSRLLEGCWKAVRCRDCAVRRAVHEVAITGRPVEHVAAHVETDGGRVDLRIGVRREGELFQLTVEKVGAIAPAREAGST